MSLYTTFAALEVEREWRIDRRWICVDSQTHLAEVSIPEEKMSNDEHHDELADAEGGDHSTKACVECAEMISRDAKKCRHCGAYQRRSARWVGPLV